MSRREKRVELRWIMILLCLGSGPALARAPVVGRRSTARKAASPLGRVVLAHRTRASSVRGAMRSLKALEWLYDGDSIVTVKGGGAKLLLLRGCVVRMEGGTKVVLTAAVDRTRCASVLVLKGRVFLSGGTSGVSGRVGAIESRIGPGGRAHLAAGASPLLCNLGGWMEFRKNEPGRKPAQAAPGGAKPDPSGKPAGSDRSIEKPEETFSRLIPSACTNGTKNEGASMAQHWEKFSEIPQVEPPEAHLAVKPLIPKKVSMDKQSSGESQAQVSAASGSMCLEGSSSGSAAGNVQQGNQGIDKPPPTARLRIRVTISGR